MKLPIVSMIFKDIICVVKCCAPPADHHSVVDSVDGISVSSFPKRVGRLLCSCFCSCLRRASIIDDEEKEKEEPIPDVSVPS